MMRDKLTDILASCLDSIEQGERTIEECLALYPEHRNDLEPLLSTVATIRERADFAPRSGFRQASRARLLKNLRTRRLATSWKPVRRVGRKAHPIFSKGLSLVWTTMLVLLATFLIGGGTVYASSDALPGDFLYPVKLSTEDVRLLVSNDADDVSLAMEFVQIRMEEIQVLIESGREGDLYLAVDLLSDRIAVATESLAAVAEDDPERAAQAAFMLEQALSVHTEVLISQLGTVPDRAKPAIERAILASSKGQAVVQNLFENELPGGGPPEEKPDPGKNPPGGGPPEGVPDSGGNPSGGGRPDEIPDPAATHPGGGPPDGVPGPPTWVPGGRP
jgi:hypothetical protein